MRVEKVSKDIMKKIYEQYMVNDFPKDELKPYAMLEKMYDSGKYTALCFYEDDYEDVVAYAMLVESPNKYMLLDYFAVNDKIRGKGYGSKALEMIYEMYTDSEIKAIIIEIEDINYSQNEEEKKTRIKRKKFYLAKGVRESEVVVRFYNVEYNLLYRSFSDELTNSELFEEYKNVLGTFTTKENMNSRLECLKI